MNIKDLLFWKNENFNSFKTIILSSKGLKISMFKVTLGFNDLRKSSY